MNKIINNKTIRATILVIFVILSIYFLQNSLITSLPFSYNETIKLTGTITNLKDDCGSDGCRRIELDNKRWISLFCCGKRAPNSLPDVVGKISGTMVIGKKVEVYGKKIMNNDISIFGSKEYFVKIVE